MSTDPTIDGVLDPDAIIAIDAHPDFGGPYSLAVHRAFAALGHTPSTRDWNWVVSYVVATRAEEDADEDEDVWSIDYVCRHSVISWGERYGPNSHEFVERLEALLDGFDSITIDEYPVLTQTFNELLDAQECADSLAAAINAPPTGLQKIASQFSLASLDRRVTAASPPPPPPVVTTVGRCYVCDGVGDLVSRVCAGCRR